MGTIIDANLVIMLLKKYNMQPIESTILIVIEIVELQYLSGYENIKSTLLVLIVVAFFTFQLWILIIWIQALKSLI